MSLVRLPEIQNVTCDKYNNRASSGSGCTIQGSNDWWYRTFLKYDLSNMPQDIEIISAKLYMYCYRWNDNASSGTTNISRITSDWTEESVTKWYSTQPSTTGTYLSSNVSPPAVGNWTEWDITSLVQEWYTGVYPNYGLYIKNNNEGSYRVDWNVYSRKQGDGEFATYIEVTYEEPEPPTPWQELYQEVEWIESTGTQYIDTGIKVDNTYGYKCKFQALNTDDSIIVGVCGTGDSRWCLNSSTTLNPSWNAIYSFSNTDTNAHTVQYNYLNDRKRYIDNVEGIAITSTLQSAASNYDVLIFAAHWRSTSVSLYSRAKLFSLEITKDTELIRNFIPCYRKSDNVIGLYDLVNDVFYTNAGTGEFNIGPNVYNLTCTYTLTDDSTPVTVGYDTYADLKTNLTQSSTYKTKLATVILSGKSQDTDASDLFNSCQNMTALDITGLDTSNVTNMNGMFAGVSLLRSLDLSNFDTSSCTNMGTMFSITNLTKDLSNFDTSNVTIMNGMFSRSVGDIIFGDGWDTSKVTTFKRMFYLSDLNNYVYDIDFSTWNTSSCTDMERMFATSNMQQIDISTWDLSNVTDMSRMFANVDVVTEIRLPETLPASGALVDGMFDYSALTSPTSPITTIYCDDDWSTIVTASASVFNKCTSLVGAISYDAEKISSDYMNPTTGYFTPYSTSIPFKFNGNEVNEIYFNNNKLNHLYFNTNQVF